MSYHFVEVEKEGLPDKPDYYIYDGGKLMDELLEWLRAQAVYLPEKFSKNAELLDVLMKAADAIEELSADCDMYRKGMTDEHNKAARLLWDKEHCWIPVTEKLPEKFENVLVANKRGKHYDIDKGWWNGSFFDRCAKGGYHNVTHWMPLPQPPEEEIK